MFRPDLNEQRMHDSCVRLEMPTPQKGVLWEAVKQVVRANEAYSAALRLWCDPLYQTLYVWHESRHRRKASGRVSIQNLYDPSMTLFLKGGAKPLTIRVSDFDRAAPNGTGHIKAGLNYAMSLHAIVTAHKDGFDENMYLDPATRTKVEETGGANFLFVTKGQ